MLLMRSVVNVFQGLNFLSYTENRKSKHEISIFQHIWPTRKACSSSDNIFLALDRSCEDRLRGKLKENSVYATRFSDCNLEMVSQCHNHATALVLNSVFSKIQI